MKRVKEAIAILSLVLAAAGNSTAQRIGNAPNNPGSTRSTEIEEPLSPDPAALFVIVVSGKHGFIDRTGSVVIPPRFDEAKDFSKEGLAPASLDGKWGHIDRKGDWVVQPKFQTYVNNEFSEGLAAVNTGDTRDGKWGFINISGEVVVEPKYELAGRFSDGLAFVVSKGKRGFIDRSGKLIVPPKYDLALFFTEGLAAVRKDDKWGFIDTTGMEVIPLRYSTVRWFSDGLAMVMSDVGLETVFIDKRGRDVFTFKGWANPFSEGLAAASPDYKTWGFLNKKGQFAIKRRFQSTGSFHEGLAAVKLNDKWGFIDKKGMLKVEPQFDAAGFFRNGIAAVGVGGTPRDLLPFGAKGYGKGQMGYINATGKYIWKPTE